MTTQTRFNAWDESCVFAGIPAGSVRPMPAGRIARYRRVRQPPSDMRPARPASAIVLLATVIQPLCLGVIDYSGGPLEDNFATFRILEPPHYGPGWYLYVEDPSAGAGQAYRAAGLNASLNVTGDSLRTYARGNDHLMALVLRNTAERAIESFTLRYFGEQWTVTGAGLGDHLAVGYCITRDFTAPDRITPRTPGTTVMSGMTDLPELRFDAPRVGLSWMAIDGKLGGNREELSVTIDHILWEPGQYLVLRWANYDQDGDSMTEQGLGIADIQFTGSLVSSVLSVTVDGDGTVEKSPDKPFYALGEEVRLSPVPGRWHAFSQWADGSTSNPRLVTIGGANNYTAVFVPTEPLETLEFNGVTRRAPVGMPAVFVNGQFASEEPIHHRGPVEVAMQTTFDAGTILYTLDGTDPAVSATVYTGSFTLPHTATLRAVAYDRTFTQAVQTDPAEVIVLPTVRAFTRGGGSVLIDPPTGPYGPDQSVAVAAVPDAGWEFLHWFGDLEGEVAATNLVMAADRCVEAVFGTPVATSVVGSGGIWQSPLGDVYPYGTVIRFAGLPLPGNSFARWANAAEGTTNPLEFAVTEPGRTVTAIFSALTDNRRSLVVVPIGAGTVRIEPPGNSFASGTRVTLTPLPSPGQRFTGWDDTAGAVSPLVVTLSRSRSVVANFTQRPSLAFDECQPFQWGHPVRFSVEGAPWESNVRLEASPALEDWSFVDSARTRHGRAQVTDWREMAARLQFYRLGP